MWARRRSDDPRARRSRGGGYRIPGRDPLGCQQTRWNPEETTGCEPAGRAGLEGQHPSGRGFSQHCEGVLLAAPPAGGATVSSMESATI